MSLPEVGQNAPEFAAVNQDGKLLHLADFKGKKLVLYFYPKDDTPGCTAEACDLRDNHERFLKAGYAILGVSPDDAKSIKNSSRSTIFPSTCWPIQNKPSPMLMAYGWKRVCTAGNIWVSQELPSSLTNQERLSQ